MQRGDKTTLPMAMATGLAAGLGLAALAGASWAMLGQPSLNRLPPGLLLVWLLAWALVTLAAVAVWKHSSQRPRQAAARLAEQVRVLRTLEAPSTASGSTLGTTQPWPALTALADEIQALATQRNALRSDMAEQVNHISGRVQQEKDRLAALLAELQQCVLVCNVDGRILLYNQQARKQLGELGTRPQAGVIGIGRSVYGLLDRALMQHALRTLRQRLAQGPGRAATSFVTHTHSGQLLRVQMTPVLAGTPSTNSTSGNTGQALPTLAQQQQQQQQPESGTGPAPSAPPATATTAPPTPELTGFVLLLEDVTHHFAQELERDNVLHSLTEGNRASLASMHAAMRMLSHEEPDPEVRKRFLEVIHAEMDRMGQRIDELAQRAAQGVRARWPLQAMLGQEFLAAAEQYLQAELPCPVLAEPVEPGLWLQVDSYSLLQMLAYLAQRLVDEFGVHSLQLRLQATEHPAPATSRQAEPRLYLDLIWTGHAMSTETVMSWEMDPITVGAGHSTWSVREVVGRHAGEMWFERERFSHQAFFRFSLPLCEAKDHNDPLDADADIESRPEFYDFDLFQHEESDSDLDERPLSSLRYTVFDTETTGLNPSGGDQILQIGAVRIVNGRVLGQERFDQLVHPGRDIPAAGIPIHGITPDMVANQPRIEAVLPSFHRFAEDSVLVAHNAAFDMKFLQLLERRTGLAFRQPVLDTLLLSAVVHPNQESHRLEALAERFGVTVLGRHTALGDALVTAEVWLHLLAQLQAMGIHTLRQAREAAQQTYYARLKY